MKYEDLPRDKAGEIIPAEAQWPIQIGLLRPLDFRGQEVASVELREPRARDIEIAWGRGSSEMSRLVHLAALIGELDPEAVRDLKSVDFMRIAGVVGAFL